MMTLGYILIAAILAVLLVPVTCFIWYTLRDNQKSRAWKRGKAQKQAATNNPHAYLYFSIEARETPRTPEEQAIYDARAKARQDLDRQIAEDHQRWLIWREIEDLTA